MSDEQLDALYWAIYSACKSKGLSDEASYDAAYHGTRAAEERIKRDQ